MIRILVAEDHVIARVGVTTIVNKQPDMTVIAEAYDGAEAIALYRKHQPDVALLDVRMPNISGLDATTAILTEFPNARVIALTSYGGDADVRRALKAGVVAYLTKDLLQDELLTAIRVVHKGHSYIPATLAAVLNAQGARPDLTQRELQVLEFVVRGMANKQIAYSLNLSEFTIKNHLKRLLDKLGVQDRTQAATAAIERGLVHLG
jgi:two-component system, NarL family, response regulator